MHFCAEAKIRGGMTGGPDLRTLGPYLIKFTINTLRQRAATLGIGGTLDFHWLRSNVAMVADVKWLVPIGGKCSDAGSWS